MPAATASCLNTQALAGAGNLPAGGVSTLLNCLRHRCLEPELEGATCMVLVNEDDYSYLIWQNEANGSHICWKIVAMNNL